MVFVITGLSFLTVFLLVLGFSQILMGKRLILIDRLNQLNTSTRQTYVEDMDLPLFERVVRPLLQRFSGKVSKMMPKEKKASLEKRLMMAGNPSNLTPEQFRTMQYFGAAFGLGLGMLVGILSDINPMLLFLMQLIFTLIGFIIPDTLLNSWIKSRQQSIQKNLPEVLDLLTVSVEAGLGFDAAVSKVVEKSEGPVASEFSRVLEEINIGKPRREALRDMAERNGVDDLTTFVGAIIQADTLGVSISNVLRIQSEQMRQKRRQLAEEKAMKAPVKMLIPMVLFIFPTVFIVLLGPGVVKVLADLAKK